MAAQWAACLDVGHKKSHPLRGGLHVARYNSTLKNHNNGGIKSLKCRTGQSTQSLYYR